MDIEDRAEKWVRGYEHDDPCDQDLWFTKQDMINAYLAGSAQTAADYAKHYSQQDSR